MSENGAALARYATADEMIEAQKQVIAELQQTERDLRLRLRGFEADMRGMEHALERAEARLKTRDTAGLAALADAAQDAKDALSQAQAISAAGFTLVEAWQASRLIAQASKALESLLFFVGEVQQRQR